MKKTTKKESNPESVIALWRQRIKRLEKQNRYREVANELLRIEGAIELLTFLPETRYRSIEDQARELLTQASKDYYD